MKTKTAGDSNKRKEVGAGKGKNIVRSSHFFFRSFRSNSPSALEFARSLRLARSRTERKRKTSVFLLFLYDREKPVTKQ